MYCSRFAFLRVFNSETVEILHIAKLGFKKRMSIVLSTLDYYLAYTVSLL